ncbi:WXG100 family type VII secretion target, partial [Kitasatospora herbaricolor]
MADKEKPAEPEGFQAPKNADYDAWDAAAILHIFRGQDKAYSSEKSAGWSAPEPETIFQAKEAVIDAAAAMTDAHQIISQLSRQMERGDYWSGPTATMFSNLLTRAETVLVDHATALDHHQVRLDESGRALAATRDGILEIWHAATRAVGVWWSGLNLSQQMEWMKTHDYPPVQEKDGRSFYRVGDFPTIMEPMTEGMRELLKDLAGYYRTGIVNMPSPGSPEFSGAGSGAGGPGGVLPPAPKLGDLSGLGGPDAPQTLTGWRDLGAPQLGDVSGLGGVDGGAGDLGAPQLRELSQPGVGGVGDLGAPQLGDLSGLGGVGDAGAGLGGAGGVGDLGAPQ